VNTLLLAYAGASMPLVLLFAVSDQPLDMVANSELLALEIVRTLCGSIGLVAAVPVTTALAAAVLRPQGGDDTKMTAISHSRRWGRAASHADSTAPADIEETPAVEIEDEPPRRKPRWEDFGPEEPDEGA
jgi:hypothetical protein